MPDDPAKILKTSQDPGELMIAAVALARSAGPRLHQLLEAHLHSAEFLARLDSDGEYRGPRHYLRVRSVVDVLAANSAPSARAVLVALTRSPGFLEYSSRVELLIEACTEMRPPPPEVLKFWDKTTDPRDPYTGLVVRATLRNGTVPALELTEKLLADPARAEGGRIEWMRTDLLEHRNNPEVLRACWRLLTGSLQASLRPRLVEVLFDFQPDWYLPSVDVVPPEHGKMTLEARSELRTIGEYALKKVELTEQQRQAVQRVMEELAATPA